MNIFLAAAVFGSYFAVFFFGTGSLAQNGIGSLRYFTMLSNLFMGFVAIAWLISTRKGSNDIAARYEDRKAGANRAGNVRSDSNGIMISDIDGRSIERSIENGNADFCTRAENRNASPRIERLKYIAATSVGLTFATIMGFLGPIYGYKEMLSGANLFMHLVTPLAAMAEIIFLSGVTYTRKDNMLAVIPPFLYGLGYLANILINGIGEWPNTNDWYWFFAWGYPVGALIYAALLTVAWLLGLLMRKLQRKNHCS